MRKPPLLLFALLFSFGIFFGSCVEFSFFFCYLLTLGAFFLSVLLLEKEFFYLPLYILVFLLGVLSFQNSKSIHNNDIFNIRYLHRSSRCWISGSIMSHPIKKNNKKTSFILKAQSVQFGSDKYACCGKTLVYAPSVRGLKYGDELVLSGRVFPYFYSAKKRTGSGKYRAVNTVFYSESLPVAKPAEKQKTSPLKEIIPGARKNLEGILEKHLTPLSAAIIKAIIIGKKEDIPVPVYRLMANSGTVHILVVSGLHVGMIAFLGNLLFKAAGFKRRLRIFLIIPLLGAYCLLTGASTPVLRSTLMAAVFICAYLAKSESDITNSLSLAALVILFIDPQTIFDIGSQLSFGSVLSIVYLTPVIMRLLRAEKIKKRPFRFFIGCLSVSLAAWIGTAWLIWHNLRTFSPVAPLANIFAVPLASLIVYSSFAMVFAAAIFPAAAYFFSLSVEFLVALLLKINAFLVCLPGAYFRG